MTRVVLLVLVAVTLSACAASPTARPSVTSGPTSSAAALRPDGDLVGAPVALTVPRIGVRTRLDRLRLEPSGALQKPPRWQVAGWYAGGPRPGDPGPAVIAGHVDSPDGPAVFARLNELRRGDVVRVRTRAGSTVVFRVTRLLSAPKRHFPTRAVYGPTPDAQLRLITCDGTYDRARDGYQDNLVVFATQVPS